MRCFFFCSLLFRRLLSCFNSSRFDENRVLFKVPFCNHAGLCAVLERKCQRSVEMNFPRKYKFDEDETNHAPICTGGESLQKSAYHLKEKKLATTDEKCFKGVQLVHWRM